MKNWNNRDLNYGESAVLEYFLRQNLKICRKSAKSSRFSRSDYYYEVCTFNRNVHVFAYRNKLP